jgi:hypothetical protein
LKGKGKNKDQFLMHQILNDEIEINKFKKITKKEVNSC